MCRWVMGWGGSEMTYGVEVTVRGGWDGRLGEGREGVRVHLGQRQHMAGGGSGAIRSTGLHPCFEAPERVR